VGGGELEGVVVVEGGVLELVGVEEAA
jgi:hypothetical protein